MRGNKEMTFVEDKLEEIDTKIAILTLEKEFMMMILNRLK